MTVIDQDEDRRVLVWFEEHLLRAYRAEPSAAMEYAKAVGRHFPGLIVTVDKEAVDGLVQLPCEQLWTLTP
ncbi:hypothetical protein [Microlunatus speluncae]|uniref:hypothetical protein n=1 Tax=Microlunatus speluncae TaxID=2594267 RepID=UPI0012667AEA|nr:hypothetical protein [Microlunatus speluncae]